MGLGCIGGAQDSMPIDVGRAKRLPSGSLRKALRARDGHCQWSGCDRPASWCQGHHLVHEHGWQIVRCEDGQIMVIAPTVTFGQPRAPD